MDSSGREGVLEGGALPPSRPIPQVAELDLFREHLRAPEQPRRRVGSFVRSLLFELQEMLQSGFSASWKVNEKLQGGPVVPRLPTELSNDLHAQQNLKFQGSFST